MLVKKAAVVAALAIAGTLFTGTAAQARPANCVDDLSGNFYQASCWGGTGSFRAYVDCWRNGSYTPRKGLWIAPGQARWQNISFVTCASGETPGTHFAELR